MGKLKAIMVVLLVVMLAAVGSFYGLNRIYQQNAFAEAELHLDGATRQALNSMRVKSFESIQALIAAADQQGLAEVLSKTPDTQGKPAEEAKTALEATQKGLMGLMDSLVKTAQAEHLQIIDGQGRLVAQKPGDEWGESLQGLPIIQECLAGVARDGLLSEGEKLFILAAAPVRSAGGKTVGCLQNRMELTAVMFKPFAQNSKVNLALFVDKKVRVATLNKAALAPLSTLLDSNEIIQFGDPSEKLPLLINLKGKAYLASSLKLELGSGNLHLISIIAMPPKFEALQDFQMKLFYGAGALLVFGFLLAFFFSGNKDRQQLVRLHDAVKVAIEANGSSNIDPNDFAGIAHFFALDLRRFVDAKRKEAPSFRTGTSDVGDLLGQSSAAASPDDSLDSEPDPDKLDFDGLLGDSPGKPSEDAATPLAGTALQPDAPAAAPNKPAAAPGIPAPPAAQKVNADGGGPSVQMPGDLASFFDDEEDDSTREVDAIIPLEALPDPEDYPVPKPQPAEPGPIREAAPVSSSPPSMSFEDFPPDLDLGEDEDDQITSGDYRPDATVVAQVPDALLKAASTEDEGSHESSAAPLPKPPVMPAPPPPPPPMAPMSSGSQEDVHFREVFDKFLQTKKQCGESLAGLTVDKFTEKLRKNTSDLKGRYNCSSVRFQVYVKNGKTALKATPIK
ncbi:MAG: hypothetical protein JRF33_13115 [Deltaproteobacteria bacterium]|nr:hypothetical protein [Deltaproteobacteria bacterium]